MYMGSKGICNPVQLVSMALLVLLCSLASIAVDTDDNPRSGLMPEALVSLGSEGSYALVVSKAESRLDVYLKNSHGAVKKVASYRTSTGRGIGDKLVEGDLKTPEGVYYFTRIREDQTLPSKYGIRAFDMNYPNKLDLIENKTGYGIWLHGTDEPERLGEPRTSEGCVVVHNDDLKEISDFVTLYRTPVIIGEDIVYADSEVIAKDQRRVRDFLESWLRAWAHQDIEAYGKAYAADFRGGRNAKTAWLNRKRLVFEATSWAEIQTSDIKILRDRNHMVVSFYQRYCSNLMDDTGIKWVYLKEEGDALSIVNEEWYPVSKVRAGRHWGEENVQLSKVVAELGEVALDSSGGLSIVKPQMAFSNKQQARQPAEETAAESADNNTETASTPEHGVVRVENARLLKEEEGNILIQFDVVNKVQTGNRRRGWVYIVAQWDSGKAYTSFPSGVTTAVPRNPAEGDSYGIRWFKTVEAKISRPEPGAALTSLQAFIYDQQGNQTGGYEIINNPSEVR